ncbi:MAG: hypothetical protein VW338_09205 [Rhodospirillaceae bacterium]
MYDIVAVSWVDTMNSNGWDTIAETVEMEPAPVVTVGFLIKKTKDKVVVAHGLSGDSALGATVIPAAWVKSIDVLRAA